jgi:hypothetical protein
MNIRTRRSGPYDSATSLGRCPRKALQILLCNAANVSVAYSRPDITRRGAAYS